MSIDQRVHALAQTYCTLNGLSWDQDAVRLAERIQDAIADYLAEIEEGPQQ